MGDFVQNNAGIIVTVLINITGIIAFFTQQKEGLAKLKIDVAANTASIENLKNRQHEMGKDLGFLLARYESIDKLNDSAALQFNSLKDKLQLLQIEIEKLKTQVEIKYK
jgi:peptidoglycan hydrolase CwlO-like protein